MSTRKRSLSSEESNPPKKKRKLRDPLICDRLNKLSQDNRINDVVFMVGIGDNTQQIYGIKALFAAHSDVLKSMLFGGMLESINKQVNITDITIDAFEYIKQYTHFSKPSLQYKHVIDILYAAQKYLIHDIVIQCKQKILSVNNLDTFYLIMNSIAQYAPSTFELILSDIIKSDYVQTNINNIINADKMFNKLVMFEVKLLVAVINDEFLKYTTVKSYCKSITNNHLWKLKFNENFSDLISFNSLTVNQLLIHIRNDQSLEEKKLFELICHKIEEIQKKSYELQKDNKILSKDLIKEKELTNMLEESTEHLNEHIEEMQMEILSLMQNEKSLDSQIAQFETKKKAQSIALKYYKKEANKSKQEIEKLEKKKQMTSKQNKEMKRKMEKMRVNYKNVSSENETNVALIKEMEKTISSLRREKIREQNDCWFNF